MLNVGQEKVNDSLLVTLVVAVRLFNEGGGKELRYRNVILAARRVVPRQGESIKRCRVVRDVPRGVREPSDDSANAVRLRLYEQLFDTSADFSLVWA